MAGVNEQLIAKLKSSLPKPTTPTAAPKVKTEPVLAESMPPAPEAPAVPNVTTKPALIAVRPPKLCVAVYPTDTAKLDSLKAFMSGKGFRNLSDSEVLRLSCRAVKVGDDLVAIYEKMREEDGRRRH